MVAFQQGMHALALSLVATAGGGWIVPGWPAICIGGAVGGARLRIVALFPLHMNDSAQHFLSLPSPHCLL